MKPTIIDIQRAVSDWFKISVMDMCSPRTSKDITRARHAGMWLCRHYTSKSFPVIGREFGDRNHSSVLNAVKAVETKRMYDLQLAMGLKVIPEQRGWTRE